MNKAEITGWLSETGPARLQELYRRADTVRKNSVGDDVHLRGLIEISNHCRRSCAYCGIGSGNKRLSRYRITRQEILTCARQAVTFGYGTVVLQAGEDPALDQKFISEIIIEIKGETPLAVTLSLGERSLEELYAWKQAGADRYLLRFETSDKALFERIHPPAPGMQPVDRIALLRELSRIGYETGSGVMVGIPGQTMESLADDILLFQTLDLDMIGIGPYIPHPETPLFGNIHAPGQTHASNNNDMAYKMVALSRLHCPEANIPATTAVATLDKENGRENALQSGANIVMPNLTPPRYRPLYEIYPAKACVSETAEECMGCLRGRIMSIGRRIGTGPGGRRTKKTLYSKT